MKSITVESLGVKFQVTNVPETVAEFDTAAKKDGATLSEAINNVLYRGTYPTLREPFLDLVEKETGIARAVRVVKNKDGSEREEWDESEGKYFARVLAERNVKADAFQHLADRVTVAFDPSATERKPAAPKAPSKAYLEAATKLVQAGTAEKAATKLSKKIGRAVNATDPADLARAIKEWDEMERKSRMEALGA